MATEETTNDSLRLPDGGDLDLLMVGRSGNGKMSAGNAILGRKTFTSLDNKKTHQVGYSAADGRIIKVVDVLGFCHYQACSHSDESAQVFSDALSKGIGEFPTGFNSILFVISLVKRITKEEEKVIKALKEILGDDVIKKYGVVLVTHGDSFDAKIAKSDDVIKGGGDDGVRDQTFSKWCRSQKGFLHELFEECDFRCVLFDSVTKNSVIQKKQRLNLVKLVDNFDEKHSLYTLDSYMKSKKKNNNGGHGHSHSHDPHDHSAGECKLPMILENITRENSLIQDAAQKALYQKKNSDKNDSSGSENNIHNNNSNNNDLKLRKIKKRSHNILHEISHHEPEKLGVIKPEMEQISEIVAGEHDEHDGRKEEDESEETHHNPDHDHGHDDNDNKNDDHHHDHDHEHHHHHHDHHHDHNNENNDDNDDDDGASVLDLDDDKLNLIIENTNKVKAKLVEIKDKEEDYHSWISSSVTSPVRHLINTAFPSVVEGVMEVADFIFDTIFD